MSYVVREVDALNYSGCGTWKEKDIATASLTGEKLLAGDKTMHNIICSNISEDSYAYTWIKPRLNDRNVILDTVALRGKFSENVADQVLGGQATVKFNKLFYRRERQMSFEAFIDKFANAINDKERAGRTMSNPDIVNDISDKVQCCQIYHSKSTFQVQKLLNRHVCKNILDTLSVQVSELSFSKPIRNVSVVLQSNRYTRDGHCPDSGVRTSNEIVFIGIYPDNKRRSESVKPYW